MKISILTMFIGVALSSLSLSLSAQTTKRGKHLFIDVHQLTPGKVTYEAVAGAHAKDLAVQGKHNVQFLKFWVDEEKGTVYCLSSSSDSAAVRNTHAEAHGLLPDHIYPVTDGMEAALKGKKNLFL
ncbi:MAG TPA: DUF4242 domain-containing protein, partial [Chitinophagaceae bacterium]